MASDSKLIIFITSSFMLSVANPAFPKSDDIVGSIRSESSRIMASGARQTCTQIQPAKKETLHPTNRNELNLHLSSAKPGDTIEFPQGDIDWGEVSIRKNSDITLTGNSKGTTISGSTRFVINSERIVIRNFVFSLAGEFGIRVNRAAFQAKIQCNLFKSIKSPPHRYGTAILTLSDDTEISDNQFQNFDRRSFGVSIGGSHERPESRRAWVHHNTFKDSEHYDGTQGGAAISIGIGGSGEGPTNEALVEDNLISNWSQDPEIIEVKSSRNILRYNKIVNSGPAGHISNRRGNENVYYGNLVNDARYAWRVSGKNNIFALNSVDGGNSADSAYVFFTRFDTEREGNYNYAICNYLTGFNSKMTFIGKGGSSDVESMENVIQDQTYDLNPKSIELQRTCPDLEAALLLIEKTTAQREYYRYRNAVELHIQNTRR